MKTLVVFYSHTGHTGHIGRAIAEAADAELLQLETREEEPAGKVGMLFRGVWQVLCRKRPDLREFTIDPNDFDLLFLGTPVWGGTFAPAVRTFLSHNKFENKRVALFCCHAGGKGGVFRRLRAALEGNSIIGEIDFVEPLRKDTESKTAQAAKWARELVGSDL